MLGCCDAVVVRWFPRFAVAFEDNPDEDDHAAGAAGAGSEAAAEVAEVDDVCECCSHRKLLPDPVNGQIPSRWYMKGRDAYCRIIHCTLHYHLTWKAGLVLWFPHCA
jgi:hypothetical protein